MVVDGLLVVVLCAVTGLRVGLLVVVLGLLVVTGLWVGLVVTGLWVGCVGLGPPFPGRMEISEQPQNSSCGPFPNPQSLPSHPQLFPGKARSMFESMLKKEIVKT